MRRINPERFVKSIFVLFLVSIISGCGDQPEESTKQSQSEERVETAQIDEHTAKPESTEAEESAEESLESILARADEIIQRTGSAVETAGDDVKHEVEETAEKVGEKADATLAQASKAGEVVKEAVSDKLKTVKTTPNLIRKIQQALKEAGLNPGPADGMMGPRTQNALVDFQKQHGLTEGKITKETLQELGVAF